MDIFIFSHFSIYWENITQITVYNWPPYCEYLLVNLTIVLAMQSPAGRSWHGVSAYHFNGLIIILSSKDGFQHLGVGNPSMEVA